MEYNKIMGYDEEKYQYEFNTLVDYLYEIFDEADMREDADAVEEMIDSLESLVVELGDITREQIEEEIGGD